MNIKSEIIHPYNFCTDYPRNSRRDSVTISIESVYIYGNILHRNARNNHGRAVIDQFIIRYPITFRDRNYAAHVRHFHSYWKCLKYLFTLSFSTVKLFGTFMSSSGLLSVVSFINVLDNKLASFLYAWSYFHDCCAESLQLLRQIIQTSFFKCFSLSKWDDQIDLVGEIKVDCCTFIIVWEIKP